MRLKKVRTVTSIYSQDNLLTDENFYELRDLSVVFFESRESFMECASMVKWAFKREKRYQHLAHAPGLQLNDLYESNLDGFSVDHVSFLVDKTETSISLVTDFMFTQEICRVLYYEPINRFELSTLKWENSVFFPKKYQNFHGCDLTIIKDELHIMELLGTVFIDHLNARFFECKSDMEGCDLISVEYPFVEESANLLSDPHGDEKMSFMIGPGEPYTDLERTFMMFDSELWMVIGMTLIIGLMTTVILEFV